MDLNHRIPKERNLQSRAINHYATGALYSGIFLIFNYAEFLACRYEKYYLTAARFVALAKYLLRELSS